MPKSCEVKKDIQEYDKGHHISSAIEPGIIRKHQRSCDFEREYRIDMYCVTDPNHPENVGIFF